MLLTTITQASNTLIGTTLFDFREEYTKTINILHSMCVCAYK